MSEESQQPMESEVTVPEKFQALVSSLEQMTVMDLAELVHVLEKKFGVSAAAPIMAVAGAVTVAAPAAEEKTEFTVELTSSGTNKIAVIKVIRELTQLGLKDAKDLVEAAPKVVKEGLKKEDAEAMKKKLEETGAKVTLK